MSISPKNNQNALLATAIDCKLEHKRRHDQVKYKTDFSVTTYFGFTLIELMATLSIILIISQSAIPTFRKMVIDKTQQRISQSIESDLRYARNYALSYGTKVFLEFKQSKWTLIENKNNTKLRISRANNHQFSIETTDNLEKSIIKNVNTQGIWNTPYTLYIKHRQCRNVLSEIAITSIGNIRKKTTPCILR